MKVKTSTTITLSSEELNQMIATYMKEKYGYEVSNVHYQIGKRTVGFGMCERDETVFIGASIEC